MALSAFTLFHNHPFTLFHHPSSEFILQNETLYPLNKNFHFCSLQPLETTRLLFVSMDWTWITISPSEEANLYPCLAQSLEIFVRYSNWNFSHPNFLEYFVYPGRPSCTQDSLGHHTASSILGCFHIPQQWSTSSGGWALRLHTSWNPSRIKTPLESLLRTGEVPPPTFSPNVLNAIIFLPLLGGTVVSLSEKKVNLLAF